MQDLIIRGGTVMDGTGKPGYAADVAVKDGVITAIGDLSHLQAKKVLDAAGLAVAPGFIDAHSHSDTSFLLDDSSASKLYQGVTTEVSGQCGDSPFPATPQRLPACTSGMNGVDSWYCQSFDAFVKKFEQGGYKMATNQAILVGHGSLRGGAMGFDDRPVTPEELELMKDLLRKDLQDGAWGLSLGLEYSPGFFASSEELQELGKVVREFDGLMPCHMRNEGLKIDEAIDELLSVGRASGVHVHVSHLKIDNFRVHGRAKEVWRKLQDARREGVNVTADMYPFIASCTVLSIRCPKWCKDGGSRALVGNLTGPRRQEAIEGIRQHYFNAQRAETCLFNTDGGYWPEIIGKTLREVAEDMLHTTDYAEAAAEVLIRTQGQAGCIFFVMSEEDMLYFLSQDVGIGSDGYAYSGDPAKVPGRPHPRSYAAISEFFRRTREHKLCSTEEAVRRVTSKAAAMIGMTDRGLLEVGKVADITVFDPATIAPRSTYLDSIQLSQGVQHVVIGGGVAMEKGVQTDLRAGKFLRKGH